MKQKTSGPSIVDKYILKLEQRKEQLSRDRYEDSDFIEETNNEKFSNPLEEFIGQERVIDLLKVAILAAKSESKALDHILFYGGSGYGKSKLALCVAKEFNAKFRQFIGSDLRDKNIYEELISFLKIRTVSNKIIFIDEIHSLPVKIAETLYDAMQDSKIDGESIQPFTIIGATTRSGSLTGPLKSRFIYQFVMQPYDIESIKKIVKLNYPKFNDQLCYFIAQRSRSTPREALRLSKIVCNSASYEKEDPDLKHGKFAMEILGIDDIGLAQNDIEVLKFLANGKPKSKPTICSSLGIDVSDYEFNIEPLLLKERFITIESSGRRITIKGKQYLETQHSL